MSRLTQAVRRFVVGGRIGRVRSFVIALAVAALFLPVAEGAAYFFATATGTGVISNVQAGAAPASTVSIGVNGPFTYGGPSTANLMPSGTASFQTMLTCLTGCPAQVSTVSLSSWTSDKTGCDAVTLPGSFSMPVLVDNLSVSTSGVAGGLATITWANLAVNQSACSGAKFAFTLVTP